MRVVIVGHGMAGARLADELTASPDIEVAVLGQEPHGAYNRILLSSVLAGKHAEADIAMISKVKTNTGTGVATIDRARKVVRTDQGSELPYDHLVLAIGSRAIVPPLPGVNGDALTFRTLDDCRRILKAAEGATSALVLGGGLLGLEAARGLAGRGLKVDVVHAVDHLMERQLDPGASTVLTRVLTGLGITVHLGAKAVAGDAHSLELSDGRLLVADLVVVACGVRPETELAAAAGLTVDRGIVVDEQLRTSDRRISAIGDCAQFGQEISGLVAPAWDQARVVARQLTGAEPLARYQPAAPVTRLKANGIDLAAMGTMEPAPGCEDLSFTDPARGTYARLLIHEDRLTGAVLLGDNPGVGQVVQLFGRNAPVPQDRRSLLLGRAFGEHAAPAPSHSPALMPDAATVCQCNTVSKRQLVQCWRDGAREVTDVVARTKATTGCGTCTDAVAGIISWLEATT